MIDKYKIDVEYSVKSNVYIGYEFTNCNKQLYFFDAISRLVCMQYALVFLELLSQTLHTPASC